MNTKFYLVRHGEKETIIGDPPLTKKGIKQAKLTGNFFKNKGIDKIISSPILRTFQTATHINAILKINLEIESLLKERVNWGEGPAMSYIEFIKMWKKATLKRSWKPPAGDSSIMSGKRLKNVILNQKTKTKNNVLVTHGGIITDFLRNEFEFNLLNKIYKNFNQLLDTGIPECSITTIEYNINKDNFRLIEIANTGHLKKLD